MNKRKLGELSLKKVRDWYQKQAIDNFASVPLNQFRNLNRKKVRDNLKINGSLNNEEINLIFDEIDSYLDGSSIQKIKTSNSNDNALNQIKKLEKRISDLEHKLLISQEELKRIRRHDNLIEHLLDTGVLIRDGNN